MKGHIWQKQIYNSNIFSNNLYHHSKKLFVEDISSWWIRRFRSGGYSGDFTGSFCFVKGHSRLNAFQIKGNIWSHHHGNTFV